MIQSKRLSVSNDSEARKLCALLDNAATKLMSFGMQPALVAECPNKFNDAGIDDYWYAVRCGGTVWEQSQYFEGFTQAFAKERSTFGMDGIGEDPKHEGAKVESQHIASLRTLLQDLKHAGWRNAADHCLSQRRSLLSLVIDRDQPFFVAETPNVTYGDVFAWDAAGMFRLGGVTRFDQSIGHRQMFIFEDIEESNLRRLGEKAMSYFLPAIQDRDAASRLAHAIEKAITELRQVTHLPIALCSRYSFNQFSQSESFCELLRPEEGRLSRPTDGKWPLFQPQLPKGPATEYSDAAKAIHLAMGRLEDSRWRAEFETSFGEVLHSGQKLILYVDSKLAILVRDSSIIQLVDGDLITLGICDFPISTQPETVLSNVRDKYQLNL